MYPIRDFPTRYFAGRYFTHATPPTGIGMGYYAGRYYASRYFPGRYFPRTAIPSVATSLDEAIRSYLLASGLGLTDVYRLEIPGKRPDSSPALPPYAIINPMNEMPEWNTGGETYAAWSAYQITFVGLSGTQAQQIRDAAYRLFTPTVPARTPLAFADGMLPANGVLPGMKRQWKQPTSGTNGVPNWLFAFDCRFYVTRSMS